VGRGPGQLSLTGFRTKMDILTEGVPRSNIFVNMNISSKNTEKKIADYLKVLGSPIRVKILLSIGYGEACVCHLEAVLNKRQAYISQHLMVMRDAGILETRRDGKYIYYSVSDRNIFGLIDTAATLLEMPSDTLPDFDQSAVLPHCECPYCQPGN